MWARTDQVNKEIQMQMKKVILGLPLIAAVCVFAFAAPPVYPGAKSVDALNEASKKAGRPNVLAYNTFDSFEKVYEFYKSKGIERVHNVTAREKFALIMFKDSGYSVAIGWDEESKDKGTTIHISKGSGQ
jgi:hypothetical protein